MSYFLKQKQIKQAAQKKENLQETIDLTLGACHKLILIATSTAILSFIVIAILN